MIFFEQAHSKHFIQYFLLKRGVPINYILKKKSILVTTLYEIKHGYLFFRQ
jgi:hypothetical protein